MLKFNIFEASMDYDDSDPDGYRAGAHRFGPKIGASRLGATLYELPPGQALCPYHYESEEEWLLVLQGQVTLRHPDGEDVLGPGDVTAFPTGPAGAHKTTNNGTETVRMLMACVKQSKESPTTIRELILKVKERLMFHPVAKELDAFLAEK